MASARSEHEARTRKLYRYISEAIHKVDEGTNRSKSMPDLFAASVEIYRQKLRENCEKLIFADPILYGRKAQDLLWRKGYYETISAAKRLRLGNAKYDDFILAHINIGIGHYHQLISKIQLELNMDMIDLVDFPIIRQDDKDKKSDSSKQNELENWGRSSIQTCLVYLGDLCRYKMEFEENGDCSMAVRYYFQAASIDPKNGMPYNQLGTLFTGRNYCLDSVRYYIICLSCENPFEGAEVNLTKILDRNTKFLETLPNQNEIVEQQELIKNFICKFLNIIECCYFNKESHNFTNFCTEMLYDLKICLSYNSFVLPDLKMTYDEYNKFVQQQDSTPNYLSPKILHKIMSITLLCVNKFNKENSPKALPMKAFALAVLLQLLQKLLQELIDMGFKNLTQTEIMEDTIEKRKKNDNNEQSEQEKSKEIKQNVVNNKKTTHKIRRRRRINSNNSSDDYDSSDCTESDYKSDDSNSDGKDSYFTPTDEEDLEEEEDNDEEDDKDKSDVENGCDNNKSPTNISDNKTESDKIKLEEKPFSETLFNNFMSGDNILSVISLMITWLKGEIFFLRSCRSSAYVLFMTLVDVLNILYRQLSPQQLKEGYKLTNQYDNRLYNLHKAWLKLDVTIPLPEDDDIRSVAIFNKGLKNIKWDAYKYTCLSNFEANTIRLLRLYKFGFEMSRIGIGIKYMNAYNMFNFHRMIFVEKQNVQKNTNKIKKLKEPKNTQSDSLMRNLGKLWLSAQVHELESKVHSENHQRILPAYVVVDAEALSKYIYYVKQLVYSERRMVLIPTIVLQHIDEMKKESSKARHVIRWLETQLRAGSNYIRTQGSTETARIESLQPLKKTSKELNNFIQIIEFCNYFILKESNEPTHTQDPSIAVTKNGIEDSVNEIKVSKNGSISTTDHSEILVLLTGAKYDSSNQEESPNYVTMAQEAGVVMENIQDFYMRVGVTQRKYFSKYKNKNFHKKR